ncbi:MAG: RsmE family RNA methyltransferase [Sphaerochaetaceae bacterium]|nr:16S rRNA (uracil(1498)-N(3))-methyltransferase [Candidatus Cloacimonadota bacterium]
MNIILFETLDKNNLIDKEDFRFHHILKVLKLKEGDFFKLGIVNGISGKAQIIKIDERGITYNLQSTETESYPIPMTLLVGQVRPISMKRILRDSASFGVKNIIVSGCDTSERSYKEAKLYTQGEYKKYLLDGAMQSGQTSIPSLTLVDELPIALSIENNPNVLKVVLDIDTSFPSISKIGEIAGEVIVAIGPERGWSEKERELFKDSGYSFYRMGKRILRTETACCSAIALVLSQMGVI